MNRSQTQARPANTRGPAALASVLLAGAALVAAAPQAHARDDVRVAIRVGGPGYQVGYHAGYRPGYYGGYQPAYVYAPPRVMYRHRAPLVCDAYGYCTRRVYAPVVYAPAPVYYGPRVIVDDGYRRHGHRHHRHHHHHGY